MDILLPPDSHHLSAAEGWLELGNWLEANEELERITSQMWAHPDVLELRYEIYSMAGKWELAAEVARGVSLMLPDNSWGVIHLAFSLHELKRTQEAWHVLLPVVDRFPEEPTIRYNLACYACQLGNLDESLQWLQKAINLAGKEDIRSVALADSDLASLWNQIKEV